jgi:ABC-type branched-subunit amino acid transport system substrate-binding protein
MLCLNPHKFFSSLALCTALLVADGASTAAAQEVRIGVVLDQSSVNADTGRDYLAGARTWFDHVNSTGGVNGRRLSLIVRDDEGEPSKAVSAARELVQQERVDAFFGFVGDQTTNAVMADPVIRQSRVALYAPLSGLDGPTVSDGLVYIRPTYREEVRFARRHFSLLGNTRFSVVSAAGGFGKLVGELAAQEIRAANLTVNANYIVDDNLSNLESIATQLVQSGTQVVIVAGDTLMLAEFLKRFRRIDRGINVVGLSTINHRTLIEFARPEIAGGTMLTQVVPHPDNVSTRVQNEHLALMAKYRDEPPSHITLEGFIAAKSFTQAIARGALTRAGILASVSGPQRQDVGGITLSFGSRTNRGSQYVDLSFLRASGRLIQ